MDLVGPIRSYIENTFSPEEATSSEEDLTRLGLLRSEIVVDQQTHEQRRETLLAYYRALCVVESRFPISKQSGHIDVAFSWADAFKTNKRVSIANVHFEKAAVVFNLGASWSQLGLAADRATPDGIKTAAHAFQQAAGAFTMLRDDVLGKVSGVGGGDATVDLTEECAGMLVSLHLAQAQECFYDKAATDGKSAGILVKLAQQTHLFYEEVKTALASPPLSEHFEKSWSAHVAAKDAMFHAEALSRAAKMAEEDAEDIGSAVARLLVASTELHAAHRLAKNTGGISVHCVGAVATLRDAVDEQLRRAQRDNECVYMERVPAYEDVAPLGAAAVVKAVRPPAEAVDASAEDMFAAIVPESGFKALSKYTEKVDALIREENDVLALASDEARIALREMELPELLIAAEAGARAESPPGCGQEAAAGSGKGLPSPLDEEVASIQGAGGLAALKGGLPRLADINEACTQQIGAAESMLDAEATEDEACRGAYGPAAWTRPPSASLTVNLKEKLTSFRNNLGQAARSDDSLRRRIDDGVDGVCGVLDPVNLAAATPKLTAPMLATLEESDALPSLRGALEDLEAVGGERAGIEEMMRRIKDEDNIMSKVMAKTENYDDLFKTELAKYDRAREAIATNVSSQADILSRLRGTHARFTQMYDVSAWRAATDAHASSVRVAVAHYHELSSGLEQGLTFYSGFTEAVNRVAGECEGFVENRRREKAQLEGAVARRAEQAAAVAHHQAAAAAAQQSAAADQAAAQRAMAEAQASAATAHMANMSMSAPAPPPGVAVGAPPSPHGYYSQPQSPAYGVPHGYPSAPHGYPPAPQGYPPAPQGYPPPPPPASSGYPQPPPGVGPPQHGYR